MKTNKAYKVWDTVRKEWSTNSNRKTAAGTWKVRGFAIAHIKDVTGRGLYSYKTTRSPDEFELVTVEVVEQELLRESGAVVLAEKDKSDAIKKAEEDKARKEREIIRKKEEIARLQNDLSKLSQ